MPTTFDGHGGAVDTFPLAGALAPQLLATRPHSLLHGNLGDTLSNLETLLGESFLDSTELATSYTDLAERLEAVEALANAGGGGGGPFLPTAGGTMGNDALVVGQASIAFDGVTNKDAGYGHFRQGGSLLQADASSSYNDGFGFITYVMADDIGTPGQFVREYTTTQAGVTVAHHVQSPLASTVQGPRGVVDIQDWITVGADYGKAGAVGLEYIGTYSNDPAVANVKMPYGIQFAFTRMLLADSQDVTVQGTIEGLARHWSALTGQNIYRAIDGGTIAASNVIDYGLDLYPIGLQHDPASPDADVTLGARVGIRVRQSSNDTTPGSGTYDPGVLVNSYGLLIDPDENVNLTNDHYAMFVGYIDDDPTGTFEPTDTRAYVLGTGQAYFSRDSASGAGLIVEGLAADIGGKMNVRGAWVPASSGDAWLPPTDDAFGFIQFTAIAVGTTYSPNPAGFRGVPTQNWNTTQAGANIDVYTTQDGTLTNERTATFGNEGSLSVYPLAATDPGLVVYQFGTASAFVRGRAANSTAASPTRVIDGNALMIVSGSGYYDNLAGSEGWSAAGGTYRIIAAETYSSSGHQGGRLEMHVGLLGGSSPGQQKIVHVGVSTRAADVRIYGYGAAVANTTLSGYAARGSQGSEAAVQSGDVLLEIGGRGYNGSGYGTVDAAAIQFESQATHSGSTAQSRILFYATDAATTTRTNVASLNGAGTLSVLTRVKIGALADGAYGSAALQFTDPGHVVHVWGTATLAYGTVNAMALPSSHFSVLTATGTPGTITLNGIVAPTSSFVVEMWVYNFTGQNITINHLNGSASAANQIYTNTGAAVTITTDGMIHLIYDDGSVTGSARWILLQALA